jgi:hypothetical protein
VVIANFGVTNVSINPSFPTDAYTYPMTWYDLMNDNNPVIINNPSDLILVNSGRFRVFGNAPATTLSNNDFELTEKDIVLYPNPTTNTFALSHNVLKAEIYNMTGQLIRSFSNVISDQELNLNNVETGMYLVKITDYNGTIHTKKLLKK